MNTNKQNSSPFINVVVQFAFTPDANHTKVHMKHAQVRYSGYVGVASSGFLSVDVVQSNTSKLIGVQFKTFHLKHTLPPQPPPAWLCSDSHITHTRLG